MMFDGVSTHLGLCRHSYLLRLYYSMDIPIGDGLKTESGGINIEANFMVIVHAIGEHSGRIWSWNGFNGDQRSGARTLRL